MIHRRAAIAFTLSTAVLSGCATPPQPPRELPLFIQQEQSEVFVPAETASIADTVEQSAVAFQQTSASDAAEGGWEPVTGIEPDHLGDQSRQNLALAMASSDRKTRIEYLESAASYGNGQAHYELAKVYTEGVDRPRDLKLAQEHLTAAASANDPEATRVIGWQMIKGQGGYAQNVSGGAAVMEIAVTKSVRTQRELGMLYSNLYSDFNLNDPVKGEAYLVESYNAGDVLGALALGRLYIKQGRQAEAVAPLSFASERNDRAAAKLLASLDGTIGEARLTQPAIPDASDSEKYYQQASAIMLRKHSTDDEAKAYALFSLAADMGHNLASAELGAISGVKIVRDQQYGPGWLDAEKQSLLSGTR